MSNPPLTHLTLYDIASRPPVESTCFATNPWKARFALNFKALPYQTIWVSLPDIPTLRSSTLRLPPTRFFADGSPFYTLPILHDPNASPSSHDTDSDSDSDSDTNSSSSNLENHHPPRGVRGVLIGDSFDIATHLETQYPLSGTGHLFPPIKDLHAPPSSIQHTKLLIPLSELRAQSPHVQYAHFNNQVDALFTAHAHLMAYYMPLDPCTAEATKAEFVHRAGASSWEDFALDGEEREVMKMSLRDALGVHLVGLFGRDSSGPFVLGGRATYADFIVGAWLKMMERTLPGGEWEEMRGWHGGVFGELHDALGEFGGVM
ncbi:hypothetical protein E4U60_007784 [Claviceps pazoutovae]|uniref:Glutathione S-transferase UstS-like C-terminal domain-containing protein n=1 Tax=Claviceps pazoutovae TaxID=1649127 RepID=A0A9P7M2L1_9HYPO|nr:hypothetical protein E4U60_007784 [Claviceps pazoutovae]